jgi:hypothetical protein
MELSVTGGWQNWQTQSTNVKLKKGKNILRVYAITEGFNLNWMEIKEIEGAGLKKTFSGREVTIHPNPVSDILYIKPSFQSEMQIILYDFSGKKIFNKKYPVSDKIELNLATLPEGLYMIKIISGNHLLTEKIIKK